MCLISYYLEPFESVGCSGKVHDASSLSSHAQRKWSHLFWPTLGLNHFLSALETPWVQNQTSLGRVIWLQHVSPALRRGPPWTKCISQGSPRVWTWWVSSRRIKTPCHREVLWKNNLPGDRLSFFSLTKPRQNYRANSFRRIWKIIKFDSWSTWNLKGCLFLLQCLLI